MRDSNRWPLVFVTAWMIALIVSAHGWTLPSKSKSPAEEKAATDKEAVEMYNDGVRIQEEAVAFLAAGDSLRTKNRLGEASKEYERAGRRFEEAVKTYEKAVGLKPDLAEAHNNLGYCRRNLGDYEAALVSYERALKLKPDFAEALEYRGVALLHMGRRAEALADLERLKAIDPEEASELEEAIEAADHGWGKPW